MRDQLKRELELLITVYIGKTKGTKDVRLRTGLHLAHFSGKFAARDAGIFRRQLVDELWKVFESQRDSGSKPKRRKLKSGIPSRTF